MMRKVITNKLGESFELVQEGQQVVIYRGCWWDKQKTEFYRSWIEKTCPTMEEAEQWLIEQEKNFIDMVIWLMENGNQDHKVYARQWLDWIQWYEEIGY